MKQPVAWVSLMVGVLGLVVGGLALVTEPPPAAAPVASAPSDSAALRAEIRRMEMRIDELNDRIDTLQSRRGVELGGREVPSAGAVVTQALAAMQARPAGTASSGAADNQAAPPVDPALVQVLAEKVAQEAQQREELEDLERNARRRDRELAQWKDRLGLSAEQAVDMGKVLSWRDGRANDLRNTARNEGWTRDERRNAMRQVRTEADEKMRGVLSSTQYEEYVKIQKEERRGWWR